MPLIQSVHAREVLDSRGYPTIEAVVELSSNAIGQAIVPSGASIGSKEAMELRDNADRYEGKGVLKAISNVNNIIAPAIIGKTALEQENIDRLLLNLDGTNNKSSLGANAILAVSLATAKAAAQHNKQPLYYYLSNKKEPFVLPMPLMNIINGGVHADNNLDIQEFMIVPIGAPNFQEALRYGAEIFHSLKKNLKKYKFTTAVGDEGGFAPNLSSNEMAIELILKAIERAGLIIKKDIMLALDLASTEYYKNDHYHLSAEGKILSSQQKVDLLESWIYNYPIFSIEDPMAENDWTGWKILTERLGDKVQLVGDDLFVTNPAILKKGIGQKIANAILIKPNQIGTLTETKEAIQIAKAANYKTIISHRSGDTEDTTIADLAVATYSKQIKTGSLSRSDRIAKYNQLLRIEEQLGQQALFANQKDFSWLN